MQGYSVDLCQVVFGRAMVLVRVRDAGNPLFMATMSWCRRSGKRDRIMDHSFAITLRSRLMSEEAGISFVHVLMAMRVVAARRVGEVNQQLDACRNRPRRALHTVRGSWLNASRIWPRTSKLSYCQRHASCELATVVRRSCRFPTCARHTGTEPWRPVQSAKTVA